MSSLSTSGSPLYESQLSPIAACGMNSFRIAASTLNVAVLLFVLASPSTYIIRESHGATTAPIAHSGAFGTGWLPYTILFSKTCASRSGSVALHASSSRYTCSSPSALRTHGHTLGVAYSRLLAVCKNSVTTSASEAFGSSAVSRACILSSWAEGLLGNQLPVSASSFCRYQCGPRPARHVQRHLLHVKVFSAQRPPHPVHCTRVHLL